MTGVVVRPASRWPAAGSGVLRRWAPLALLAAVVLLVAVHPAFGLGVVVACYLLGRSSLPPAAVVATAGALVALSPLYLSLPSQAPQTWAAVTAVALVLGVLPWLIGRHAADRRRLRRAEQESAAHLQRQQKSLATETRVRERARIAKEMHDTLGHELALIALRAGALEVGVGTSSGGQATAAESLRTSATRAAEQLNTIVGMLTEDYEAPPLHPAAQDLEDVIDRARAAGMDVTLERTGHERHDRGAPVVHAAILRVVQEGVTNAVKHASGAAVKVTVTSGPTGARVSVVDDGGRAPAPPPVSGGRGVVALKERVRLLGGSVTTSMKQPGFELTARLPWEAAPTAGGPDETEPPPPAVLEERRRARRSLHLAVVVPLATAMVLAVGAAAYFTYATIASVLPPAQFARIQVGQAQDDVKQLLPPVQMLDAPRDRVSPPSPGTACSYYEKAVSFFERRDVFRVCFADSAVASTDVIPAVPS